MTSLSAEHKGSAYAVLSGLMYGLIGYFGITIMRADFSISNMLFWRFAVSSVLIALILIPKIKTMNENWGEMFKVLTFGTAFYTACSIFYFLASQYLGTGLSMVVFFTYPAIVMLLNWAIHKTKITKKYYLAIGLILIGMGLLVDMHEFAVDIIGIGVGILSSAFYAFYILSSKKSTLSPLTSTFTLSFGCAIACFIIAQIDNSLSFPKTLDLWVNIFGIGILCTAFPILLFLKALNYITGEKASILSVLEPVFVTIFGVLLLGESISLVRVIGIVIILSGALITLFKNKSTYHPLQ
jgi:drug/metabolite transporter (DMT)-like permease